MLLYAVTIFVSAFLLFLVQPVMAKQILPWFGGSAAVWTTCLVFFQSTLLAGYAYSDLTVHRLGPRMQVRVHTTLLLLSLALLPIVPGADWKPLGDENPSFRILGLLTATIGIQYFLLSTTSPLIQAWFARTQPGVSPYRLFALSNLASMLALVGYPFLLEPWSPTRAQALGWSVGYALFVGLCIAAGRRSLRAARVSSNAEIAADGPAMTNAGANEAPPTGARQLLWCTLAATGSLLLLAVSNHITQDIASIPLLWIAPLAIYLLTFILCFDASGWYRREIFLSMAAASLGVMAWTKADPEFTHELALQIGMFCTGLFVACMFCHGELARLKPAPKYLTRFYLMISLGGAGGAVLVGIVAPLVLPANFELIGGLVLCALLLVWQVRRLHPVFFILAAAAAIASVGCGVWAVQEFYTDVILAKRNFYGVMRVTESGREDASNHRRSLIHGTILHGTQFQAPDLKDQPTSYYTRTSGIGRLLESLHPRKDPLHVGVIGLGTGTIATYGAKGDTYRFYDINPDVIATAQREFTYLADSAATIELPLGDARLSLEREPKQNFDVLAIDAFSSDAIPVHLITSEALAIYKRHMKPGGVIAFHLTNRYLDLVPVVQALAEAQGLSAILIRDVTKDGMTSTSDWMLLSDDVSSLSKQELAMFASEIEPRPDWRLWTDDFNNLIQVLK